MVVCKAFSVGFEQSYGSEDNSFIENNFNNQIVVPESFSNQPSGQSMSSSDSKPLLRSTSECPFCLGMVVDGVCEDCGYELGTGIGTESLPIGNGLWILLAMGCIYFYYKHNKSLRSRKTLIR